MRFLVTGDKGYIGAVMVPMLLQAGSHVSWGSIATGSSTRRLVSRRREFPARGKTFAISDRQTWTGSMR